ncbi:tetratricopeptide repeat-containing protein [Haloferula helveola]|uniref:Tetratricopeptide repeat-containing protein n=2 Tax=Haloferula helveola TaxID=490095 RepID=A0ABM7RHB9_9BACT|nr:tetratricopeptide repeat-containing protein [Haloferula helveola]
MTLPSTRPGTGNNRPSTKPGLGNNRPGTGINRPGISQPSKPKPLPGIRPGATVRPGQNTRPVQRPSFSRPPSNNRPGGRPGGGSWWSGGNTNIGSGNTVININNNFQKNVNWSTNRRYWGYNPWWSRPTTRPWYGGSWNCGWNNRWYRHHHHHYWGGYRPLPGYVIYDDRNDFAEAIGWGLVAWGLGKLIFDSGYNNYSNPYPAQPVGNVTYSQPITVVAAEATGTEEQLADATGNSEAFIARSQDAFKIGEYLVALELCDKAIEAAPGDGALHEYRALILFALGKFGEAAGVLNPVLASGPGWDWTTMVTLYSSQEVYTDQLRRLEEYSAAKPDDAGSHFLLGYHYMVCGHLDRATEEFESAATLQPADSVSQQLADLCKASTNSASDAEEEPAEDEEPLEEMPVPEVVPLERLTGTWVADKGEDGTITLTLKADGKFVWDYTKDSKSSAFDGEFSMNDGGLLVLDTEDTQMVAAVQMPEESELKFVLAGGPPGDPGLDFKRN